MKYTFAAALFVAVLNATETETEAERRRPVLYNADYNCPVKAFLKLENLDTDDYQALSASCKMDILWERVTRSKVVERFFTGNDLKGFFEDDINLSYDTVSDTQPIGVVKRLFPRGVVTQVEFIPSYGSRYTGVFRGARNAIMRMSEFVMTEPEAPKTTPALEVKFLRDGMSSANLMTQFAFDGQPSFNHFKNRQSNIIKEMENECSRETYGKKLAEGTNHIGARSVMEMAEFDQHGKKEKNPHWPFMIEVEPYDAYGWTDKYQNDFHEQLQVLPQDTVVWKMYGYDCPPELDKELGCPEQLIGWLVSRSKTTSSLWAD